METGTGKRGVNQTLVDASSPWTPRRLWMALFCAALLARLLYWGEAVNGPYFGYLVLDSAAWYHRAAEAAQNVFGSASASASAGAGSIAQSGASAAAHAHEAYFRAPLYHYFLIAQFLLFGANTLTPALLQHLFGALGVLLIALTARKIYGARAGWIAGIIAAFYAPFIYFEGEVLDIGIQTLLAPLLLYAMARYCERGGCREALFVGAAFGLQAISRPNALLFFPVFWAGAWAMAARTTETIGTSGTTGTEGAAGALVAAPGRKTLLRIAGQAVVSGLVVCAFVLPVTARNYVVARDFVWVAWYGGVNFYIGNNPNSDGMTARTPARYREFGSNADSVEIFARREAEARVGRTLKASEIDRYWFGEGMKFIREHPGDWLGLAWKKWAVFWLPIEIRNIKDPEFVFRQFVWLRALSWIFSLRWLMPLAMMGIGIWVWGGLSGRSGRRGRSGQETASLAQSTQSTGSTGSTGSTQSTPSTLAWLAPFFALVYGLSVILFFVNARYRLPAIPAFVILGAAALDRLWDWAEQKRWKQAGGALVAALALSVLLSLNWYNVRATQTPAEDYWTLGNAAKSRQELQRAVQYYHQAIALAPDDADAYNGIGEALMAKKETIAQAIAPFARAAEIAANHSIYLGNLPLYLNNLGAAKELSGDLAGAEEAYRQALAHDPKHVIAWTNLGDVLRARNQTAPSREAYQQALKLALEHAPARIGLLQLALEASDQAAAAEQARWLKANKPSLWKEQLKKHPEWKDLRP